MSVKISRTIVSVYVVLLILGMSLLSEAAYDVKIILYDKKTLKPVAGLARITDLKTGKSIRPDNSLSRSVFVKKETGNLSEYDDITHWYVIPTNGWSIHLETDSIKIEAFRGIDSYYSRAVYLINNNCELKIPVKTFKNEEEKWYSGNVHLHYKGINQAESSRYTKELIPADGLDLVYFSYLERPGIDSTYISNKYSQNLLDFFTTETGVMFGYGEEYRHNGSDKGATNGHVMFLTPFNQPIMRPASFGKSIMGDEYEDGTMKAGIEKAREAGATILWCHNDNGTEDIPNFVMGRIHGLIMFDTGSRKMYDAAYYKYLNTGIPVSITSSSDWFISDLARTVALLPPNCTLNTTTWLQSVKKGHTYISNGPVVRFKVNDAIPGDTVVSENEKTVTVETRFQGRKDFGEIEVVINGRVVCSKSCVENKGIYTADIKMKFRITESSWIAVRVKPFEDDYYEPVNISETGYNEFGRPIFAHTSPVYIRIGKSHLFSKNAAQELIQEMQKSQERIEKNMNYSTIEKKREVMNVYNEAINLLNVKINNLTK